MLLILCNFTIYIESVTRTGVQIISYLFQSPYLIEATQILRKLMSVVYDIDI